MACCFSDAIGDNGLEFFVQTDKGADKAGGGGPAVILNQIPGDEMLLSDCSLYSNVAGFQYDYSLTEVNASYTVAGWGAFCPWPVATLLMESRQGEPFSQTAMPGSIPAHGGVINSGFADGHVESINSIQAFATACTPANALR